MTWLLLAILYAIDSHYGSMFRLELANLQVIDGDRGNMFQLLLAIL